MRKHTNTRSHFVNYEAIALQLFAAAAEVREACRDSIPALNGTAPLTNTEHVDYYAVGFRGPRQSGKTHWATQQLSPTTMMITANQAFRENAIDRGWTRTHDKATITKQVVTWRDCLADLTKGPSPEHLDALSRVTRVIVDEFSYMDISLKRVAAWSRLGGQVPEIAVID